MSTTTTAKVAGRSPRSRVTVPLKITAETRSGGELRLAGLAAPYDAESLDIGFHEVLAPGCFSESLRRNRDVLLLWQHDNAQPLARQSAGNLEVRETSRGVEFEATLPPTTVARDAVTLVRSGVVAEMSFGFVVEDDGWEERAGRRVRVVRKASLLELSLVTQAAYGQATNVGARSLQAAIEAAVSRMRAAGGQLPRTVVRDRSPYGPGSEHSWFRDRALVDTAEQHGQTLRLKGILDPGSLPFGAGTQQELMEARQRLARVEARDVSTADPGAAGFVPAGAVPAFVAQEFATSARAAAALAALLTPAELGPGGTISAPRISGGATVAMHTEGGNVSEQDIDTETNEGPSGVAAGMVDISQQSIDGAVGGVLDLAVAEELGRAFGENLDRQVVNGAGTGGELRGLLNWSGITAATYTAATPTVSGFLLAVYSLAADGATAYGQPLLVVALHSRRSLWVAGKAQGAAAPFVPTLPGREVTVNAIPTTLGASTNEDAVLVLDPAAAVLGSRPVVLETLPEAGSAALKVRHRAYQFVGLSVRQPAGIAKLTGTGLATPTF